ASICGSLLWVFCPCMQKQKAAVSAPILNEEESRIPAKKLAHSMVWRARPPDDRQAAKERDSESASITSDEKRGKRFRPVSGPGEIAAPTAPEMRDRFPTGGLLS